MTNSNEQDFAQRLTSVVEKKGPSRAAFARAIGIGDTTLKSYMSGATEPAVKELLRICEYADVTLNWLVYGVGTPDDCTVQDTAAVYLRDDDRYIYSRELVRDVVQAMEEELISANLNPTPAKRADLAIAFCYLFKQHGDIEREAIRMMIKAAG